MVKYWGLKRRSVILKASHRSPQAFWGRIAAGKIADGGIAAGRITASRIAAGRSGLLVVHQTVETVPARLSRPTRSSKIAARREKENFSKYSSAVVGKR